MIALVMFVLVFQYYLREENGWEECLRNYLFCVGWDLKPQSDNQMMMSVVDFLWLGSVVSVSFVSLTRCLGDRKGMQLVIN